jgi:hypothetical protein
MPRPDGPVLDDVVAAFEAEGFCLERAQRIPQTTCASLRESPLLDDRLPAR